MDQLDNVQPAGWNNNFYFVICGDAGEAKNSNSWVQQVQCYYAAPITSLMIGSSGFVTMPYSCGTSDQRI